MSKMRVAESMLYRLVGAVALAILSSRTLAQAHLSSADDSPLAEAASSVVDQFPHKPARSAHDPEPRDLVPVGQIGGMTDALDVEGTYAYYGVGPSLFVAEVSDKDHPPVSETQGTYQQPPQPMLS